MSFVAYVLDMEHIASFNPLVFDLTSTFVAGVQAVMRRVLYRWCTLQGSVPDDPEYGVPIPLLDAAGVTLSPADLRGFRATLEKQARAEDFVTGAQVSATLTEAGLLTVRGAITLTDGLTYSLEVGPAGAINELGGLNASAEELALAVKFAKVANA